MFEKNGFVVLTAYFWLHDYFPFFGQSFLFERTVGFFEKHLRTVVFGGLIRSTNLFLFCSCKNRLLRVRRTNGQLTLARLIERELN